MVVSNKISCLGGSPLGMYEHPINHGTNLPKIHRILSTVYVWKPWENSMHTVGGFNVCENPYQFALGTTHWYQQLHWLVNVINVDSLYEANWLHNNHQFSENGIQHYIYRIFIWTTHICFYLYLSKHAVFAQVSTLVDAWIKAPSPQTCYCNHYIIECKNT